MRTLTRHRDTLSREASSIVLRMQKAMHTLAMIVLWAASMYLFKEKKNYWITAVPATFMSAVSSTYFILAPECLGGLLNSKTAEGATIYNTAVAYPIGVIFAIAMLAVFLHATKKAAQKA